MDNFQGYDFDFITDKFGRVVVRPPNQLVAGSYNTLEFEIEVGEYGIDDSGHLKIAWPVTNAFGIPQFDDLEADNYTTVEVTGEAKIRYDFDHSGYVRPFKPCITVKVWDGGLRKGDVFKITIGNQQFGSKGLITQTYVENKVQFKILLDPFGTNQYTELPDSPYLGIIPDQPASLTIINQSQTKQGDNIWAHIRADDKYGNTATSYTGTIALWVDGTKLQSYQISHEDQGVIRVEDISINQIGVHKLRITDETNGWEAVGNPLEVIEPTREQLIFFGDLHGQTGETVGSGTIDEYLTFGREVAGLNFISHAANAFQVTNPIWTKTQCAIKEFHEPHRFVTFLGYEWSGVTSAGGDHNVYYLHDDMPIHRCSHALIEDKSDLDTDRYPVSELYNEFKGRDDVMIIPHIGGRRATLDIFDEELSPFIEIVSVHGHFQWFADEAMEKGLKTGFICSSDTHSGRPGDTFPVTYIEAVRAGLTAAYATELTREALWEAFKQRHVFGTTGARIMLEFSSGDAMMGDQTCIEGPLTFRGKVVGTAPIEKLEIIKGVEAVYSHQLLDTKTKKPNEFIIRWTGARTQYRRRNTEWSGKIKVHGAEIDEILPFAFDLPWEGITTRGTNTIEFISTTAGDYDGIHFKLVNHDKLDKVKVEFQSEIASAIISLRHLDKPIVIEAGEVEQALEFLPVYEEEYPELVEFEFNDQQYDGKPTAYYLRVLQTDGEKAWSSPIFVNWG